MILTLWKYRLEVLTVAILFALSFCAWRLYHKGGVDALEKAHAQVMKQAVTIKEKQDEIRNNRPDDAGVIKRLQQRSF